MTLQQLHAIDNFTALPQDPRFRAALTYLRANFREWDTATGDQWRGRYEVLKELEELFKPLPEAPARPAPIPPYTRRPEDSRPEGTQK